MQGCLQWLSLLGIPFRQGDGDERMAAFPAEGGIGKS
jgi:hypothetical protein